MTWREQWEMMDWPERLLVLMLFAFLLFAGYVICDEIKHPCVRTEKHWVRREAWVSFMMIGKTMFPIAHPATEGWENVCVERAP